MANRILNDQGNWVLSIGSPNSLERLKCRRPQLLKDLTDWYESLMFDPDGITFEWCSVVSYINKCYDDVEDFEYELIAEYLGLSV